MLGWGQVVDATGKPAVGVAVQPVFEELVRVSHGSPYGPIRVQATTDGEGRFVVRGIPKMDRATGFGGHSAEPAQYHFQ